VVAGLHEKARIEMQAFYKALTVLGHPYNDLILEPGNAGRQNAEADGSSNNLHNQLQGIV
jgi:hypothetical protein